MDECAHLASGLIGLRTHTAFSYRVNPPLTRMLAAVPHAAAIDCPLTNGIDGDPYRTEFIAGNELAEQRGRQIFTDLWVSRCMMLPFGLLSMLLVYHWATQLHDHGTGVLAMALLAFNPMFIGWAATITPDVPAAATGLLASYCFCRWMRSGSPRATAAVAASLGLALLTKSVWLILPVIWILVTLVSGIAHRWSWREWRERMISLLWVFFVAFLVLNVAYGFHGSGTRLRDVPLQSGFVRTFRDELSSWIPVTKNCPIGLPLDFVIGLDVQKLDFEQGEPSFVAGQRREIGVWWFYGYLWLIKMPEPLLAVIALSLLLFLWKPSRLGERGACVVLIPTIVLLGILLCSQNGLSQHGRYSLSLLPLGIVALSGTLAKLSSIRWLRWGLIVTSVAIALNATPNMTSYYNWLSGGSLSGHRHLLGADTDWGQDYLLLEDWKHENLDRGTLHCWLHGSVQVGRYQSEQRGIFPIPGRPLDPRTLTPGWYAIGVNALHGFERESNVGRFFATQNPAERIGNTIVVYCLKSTVNLRGRGSSALFPDGNPETRPQSSPRQDVDRLN
ncbi:ArnT family glycosyltransferase [Rhodopirellula sp. P2]|uniref:ArnT family glycosyltransferase n=1 Tax=Rhodopirellula sp. P2 TaxID=2127060 RepID=UPI002367E56C|nr:glycosyltransferase family 39 protein [Rhodopirellula sp. P2]WDQ17879.1 glycosyltransferase family 39 protein [Rhodopirellula sp. P2]